MEELPGLTSEDRSHLRRCVDLAREALAAGDDPFGSVLVDPGGAVLPPGLSVARPAPELAEELRELRHQNAEREVVS